MRLLLIQGDMVAIYENKKRLAVFSGARQLDRDSAEYLRRMPKSKIDEAPVEEEANESP